MSEEQPACNAWHQALRAVFYHPAWRRAYGAGPGLTSAHGDRRAASGVDSGCHPRTGFLRTSGGDAISRSDGNPARPALKVQPQLLPCAEDRPDHQRCASSTLWHGLAPSPSVRTAAKQTSVAGHEPSVRNPSLRWPEPQRFTKHFLEFHGFAEGAGLAQDRQCQVAHHLTPHSARCTLTGRQIAPDGMRPARSHVHGRCHARP
jgi:hypothetical protein